MGTHQRYCAGSRIGVLTTQPLDRILDYRAPEGGCRLGDFVEVPLGSRQVNGVVWGLGTGGIAEAKLKAVSRVLDVPPMQAEMREFLIRAADYTLSPAGAMLRLATRVPGLGNPPQTRRICRPGTGWPTRMTDARARVLETLRDQAGSALAPGELAKLAGVGISVVKGLVRQGVVCEEDCPRVLSFPRMDPFRSGKSLAKDQAEAARILCEGLQSCRFGVTLLKGVTGSGKTEVYLEAVGACLAKGRQVLVLLPEVALTTEFLARVEERFGARPAEWHHDVSGTERRRVFRMAGEGSAQMVVGARSALFLPFRDLGLIVVDEEHDSSYKQEDSVYYNARDMAVLRASLAKAQIILASATPSLESWANAGTGKYRRLDLVSRFGAAQLPEMRAIDMRAQKLDPGAWISPVLREAVAGKLAVGEQSLLFLNRRGYAPLTLCRACGAQIGCDHCDARMVVHRRQDCLMCHFCGTRRPIPHACPACGADGHLIASGPGIERINEEIRGIFPQARISVLSSDMFRSAPALKAEIGRIVAGEADIVIGTQLVAKGHNFPNLTLVGVIDADLGLQGSDLRAAERCFQLMRQVAGRAGRMEARGLALLQTHQPEHPAIQAILSGDDEGFWRAEAAARAAAGAPPYGRMAGIILSGVDQAAVLDLGKLLARRSEPLRAIGARVYGPAPAPIARIRGRYRVRLLVQAAKGTTLQKALRDWIAQVRLRGHLRLSVDIDPQSFF